MKDKEISNLLKTLEGHLSRVNSTLVSLEKKGVEPLIGKDEGSYKLLEAKQTIVYKERVL